MYYKLLLLNCFNIVFTEYGPLNYYDVNQSNEETTASRNISSTTSTLTTKATDSTSDTTILTSDKPIPTTYTTTITSNTPIFSNETSKRPGDVPVSPNDTTILPSNVPISPINTTILPSDVPVSPSDTTIFRTDEPVSPSDTTIFRTDEPVSPSDTSIFPSEETLPAPNWDSTSNGTLYSPTMPPDLTTPNTTLFTNTSQELNFIKQEMESMKSMLKIGYFSTTLIKLLNITQAKDPEHMKRLLGGLLGEVRRIHASRDMNKLGPITKSFIRVWAEWLYTHPNLLLDGAANAVPMIAEKKNYFPSDLNSVFNSFDAAYCMETDLDGITRVLDDILYFPNNNKTEPEIAKDAIETLVFYPLRVIEDTQLESSLLSGLEYALIKRAGPLFLNITNRSNSTKFNRSQAHAVKTARRNFIDEIVTKILSYVTLPPTTRKSTFPDINAVYHKDVDLRNDIKYRMQLYKERQRLNQRIDYKLSSKRGVTTTTTIFTTTKSVPMKKSRYYMRKYVKRNLYKMTTKETKSTRYPWVFYTNKTRRTKRRGRTYKSTQTTTISKKTKKTKKTKKPLIPQKIKNILAKAHLTTFPG